MEIIKRHIQKRINNPCEAMSPVGIILHYVGNPGTSAAANANYFHNVNQRVSVNYVVDDREIIEIIPPDMKSYGTSDGYYNGRYIQIEMCHPDASGRITDATLERVVWLCRSLSARFGCADVLRHYDVTGKRCPLWYVSHEDEWQVLKARILSKAADDPADAKKDAPPSDWAREAVSWAVEHGILRGDENGALRLREAVTREEAVTMMWRMRNMG
ncbi:MAG: N-acetylmuramoyl-L-alanine amidase [Clostridia bacterium]|nr:N-acetylmuramoyl-L-alanine amidase [Clostridia bacterium]